MHSVKAYVRDILTWLRFLKERRGGKTVWQANREDVAAYHAARRLGASALYLGLRPPARTWCRSVRYLDRQPSQATIGVQWLQPRSSSP